MKIVLQKGFRLWVAKVTFFHIYRRRTPEGFTERMSTERMSSQLENQEDYRSDRNCLICARKEVLVVFLPYAHQVLCSNCSDSYGKKGKAGCPCCAIRIEQNIPTLGAESC